MMKAVLLFFGVLLCSVNLFAQNRQACVITKNLGGKYKLYQSLSMDDGKHLFLQIKLSPEKINKEYLLKVAQRIRETYCNEEAIHAEIWDGSDKRKFDDLVPPPRFPPWARAVYVLDKTKNREAIQFISADKIAEEIPINR
jgi:hypothetical protein